jgi:hypothetical protein
MQTLRKLSVLSLLAGLSATMSFGEVIEHPRNLKEESQIHQKAQRRWLWSTAALAAASFADIHSSLGKRESNGLLRSSDGTFGARGTGVKLAMVGGIVFGQYMLVKKNPALANAISFANFGMAGMKFAVAARNYGIDRPSVQNLSAPAPTPQYLLREQ